LSGGRRRRALLAVLISLALAFLVAELFARARFGAPLAERPPLLVIRANPHRGWEMLPSELHYTYQHPVHVNALGLRGSELGPKAEGEVRVLALGDSLIYGQGVAEDATVPHALEELLNEDAPTGRRYRVINAGHRAYSTNQELALLRELGPALSPDVTVLFWYWNDVMEPDVAEMNARFEKSGPVCFDLKARFEGWTKIRWQLEQLARKSAMLMYLYDRRKGEDGDGWVAGMTDGAMQRLDGYLAEFQSATDELGSRFALAIVPDANGLVGPHASQELERRARDVAVKRGVPVIELDGLLRALVARTGELPVLPYDGHYDREGNRALAVGARDGLRSAGLLPE
jgi:hypothetical protein